MSKSTGGFLRVDSLIELGYDPLAYRYFCLSAHYRSKLNFHWESLDGAVTSLERLRAYAYDWGVPGQVDETFRDKFHSEINDDLNMPRALATVWELAKSNLPSSTKKATIIEFDRVLGLNLADWSPPQTEIPEHILQMVEARQLARNEKRWQDADALRLSITAAGYEIEDTPQGPRVKARKN
jgi:cysteinyl-tRNA synthetase